MQKPSLPAVVKWGGGMCVFAWNRKWCLHFKSQRKVKVIEIGEREKQTERPCEKKKN